jgi:hypothetical protein
MAVNRPQAPEFRFPFILHDQPKAVQDAHMWAFNAVLDLQRANAALKSQVDAKTVTTVTSTSTGSGGGGGFIPTPFPFPGLGAVRNETGVTAYTVVTNDNGILLLLNDASPIAVTLDSAMISPYFFFVTNLGAGTATFTPTTGLINGGASFALPRNYFSMIVFDGTNWDASSLLVLPQTFSAISHEWLKDYDSSTGLFTASRPDYSDLTGTPTLPATIAPVAGEYLTGYDATTGAFSQSTPAGISVTITTAALTVGGTQGSQTFTDGILTAQTPAT